MKRLYMKLGEMTRKEQDWMKKPIMSQYMSRYCCAKLAIIEVYCAI